MKVLIVDDEKLIRDVIKEYCFENKYDVIEAENGVEALEKAGDADFIIMDIMKELHIILLVKHTTIKKQYSIMDRLILKKLLEMKMLGFMKVMEAELVL